MVWIVPSHVGVAMIISQATTRVEEMERKSADQDGQIPKAPVENVSSYRCITCPFDYLIGKVRRYVVELQLEKIVFCMQLFVLRVAVRKMATVLNRESVFALQDTMDPTVLNAFLEVVAVS